ncbi:MAG: diguanylate cyclase [Rhodocyclaceae bacterium]|nr:diguanylate cyclase [Rhodocyclaceae bacterium]
MDRFKIINDTLGHDAGDELLKEIARRLSGCLRSSDTVARQGGDEFVVVLNDLLRPEDATVVAQKLLDALSPPMTLNGREIVPGASLGFALYPQDGDTLQALLMSADKAMYAAKQAGRGQFRFFDPGLNRAANDWLEVGAELHHALERGEFELHYQPKVDLRSGAITGVEALLRWRSPDMGLVPPNKFIPILEETGLILEVGEWVIARACRQARLWQEEGLPPLRIAVNLSPRQFQQRDLAQRIRTLIDQPDFLPEYLELEITGEHGDAACRARHRHAGRAAPDRHPHCHRRLRHRLLVARGAEALPDRLPQSGSGPSCATSRRMSTTWRSRAR